MIDSSNDALSISVIVPSWRDGENLLRLLPALGRLRGLREVLVVDASGDAETEQIARANGAQFLRYPKPSRGAQMNCGAAAARGTILIFQHADTELTQAHLDAIGGAAQNPAFHGGAFFRKFDDRHPHLRWLEPFGRFLSAHGGTLFGDQTIFVRRDIFSALGGFAAIPLMEDVEFSRRLRASGTTVVLDPPVRSSGRRHASKGAWRATVQNALFLLLFKAGISPHALHRWYYRHARRAAHDVRVSSAEPLNSLEEERLRAQHGVEIVGAIGGE